MIKPGTLIPGFILICCKETIGSYLQQQVDPSSLAELQQVIPGFFSSSTILILQQSEEPLFLPINIFKKFISTISFGFLNQIFLIYRYYIHTSF
ncbi:hypothetical protein D3H55_20565 [Bacillus salacetis]|uniref:Uncharacterized protein n=1 Tax=Bacillus salacetis TaxID=2315464 RepID=A0A3A1QRS2_9BACI|nr:hypothetical protein [Bacillus salacetis]RIW28961.1 hypothetical protein D3H55_20565 [Bacillus salacetis]